MVYVDYCLFNVTIDLLKMSMFHLLGIPKYISNENYYGKNVNNIVLFSVNLLFFLA